MIRAVPHVVRGAFRLAIRAALEEVIAGHELHSEVRMVRGWKLLMLLPRMLLNRLRRGGHIPRKKLKNRFRRFQEGEWIQLLSEGQESAVQAHRSSVRRRRRHRPDDVRDRASRALRLAQLGELSAARQALEGAQLAPGDLTTLRALTDPDRRPPVPREPLTEEVATAQPVTPFEFDPSEFLLCLRTARRGAAPGPSGMTSDHLFPTLGVRPRFRSVLPSGGRSWPLGTSRQKFLKGSDWGASLHCVNLMGASGALSLVMSCGGLWHVPWQNRLPRRSNKQHHLSNTL